MGRFHGAMHGRSSVPSLSSGLFDPIDQSKHVSSTPPRAGGRSTERQTMSTFINCRLPTPWRVLAVAAFALAAVGCGSDGAF
jgi:hypothetical protein